MVVYVGYVYHDEGNSKPLVVFDSEERIERWVKEGKNRSYETITIGEE